MRDARLEAGRLQRMRHARARLEIVVVCIRVEVGEVAAVPAKHVIVVVVFPHSHRLPVDANPPGRGRRCPRR